MPERFGTQTVMVLDCETVTLLVMIRNAFVFYGGTSAVLVIRLVFVAIFFSSCDYGSAVRSWNKPSR